MLQIKDYNLVEDYNANEGVLVLKRGTQQSQTIKLSDVLESMPSGIVTKEETGMGATYLELTAQRNSIIVEPIKITAYSKAIAHKACYVGSHVAKQRGRVSDRDILNYWNDDAVKPKKFVVVADSLLRLMNLLGEALIKSSFLMIDEIDSFQTDASFRDSMEDCMDVYKTFPRNKRAMVSATTLDFSDPELRDEARITIRYEKLLPRDIYLFCSEDIETAAFETILKRLAKYADDGIMVAYNSVIGCKIIADALVKTETLAKDEVKILCSENSKELVDNYYSPLTSDSLPGRVNFLTSAYFTGYDLNTKYHLISISGNKSIIHALSEKELKQIAGRCRGGVLSETIIFDEVPFYLINKPSIGREELVKAAEKELEALKCIERSYSANSLLKNNLDAVRDLIITHTNNEGHKYIRKRRYPEDTLAISYFNIDAYLEAMRIRKELYSKVYLLLHKLVEEGHNIIDDGWLDCTYSISQKKGDRAKIKKDLALNVLQAIRKCKGDLTALAQLKYKSATEKAYIKAYQNNCEYIDPEQLLELLERTIGDRDSRRLNDLQLAAFYASLSEDEVYKRTVSQYIGIGQLFTKDELLLLWNRIYSECGLYIILKSTVKAVRLTNLHFETIKRRNGEGLAFKIEASNPLGLKVIKERAAFPTNKKFTDYYLGISK